MTISYNWKVDNTSRQIADNFIFTAHWRCTATDGYFNASIYSSCSFTGEPTIPYADVTEQDVLGWCWAGGVDKEATEASLASQIEALKNPTTANGLPWATAA